MYAATQLRLLSSLLESKTIHLPDFYSYGVGFCSVALKCRRVTGMKVMVYLLYRKYGDVRMLKLLQEDRPRNRYSIDHKVFNRLLTGSSKDVFSHESFRECVALIVSRPDYSSRRYKGEILKTACKYGLLELVQVTAVRFGLGRNPYCLQLACEGGHVEIVEIYLQTRIDRETMKRSFEACLGKASQDVSGTHQLLPRHLQVLKLLVIYFTLSYLPDLLYMKCYYYGKNYSNQLTALLLLMLELKYDMESVLCNGALLQYFPLPLYSHVTWTERMTEVAKKYDR